MKQFDNAVVIMRAQPLHIAHVEVIKKAFEVAKRVLIFVGSANSPRTIDNPFTYEERRDLITDVINEFEYDPSSTYRIYPLDDFIYDDPFWRNQIYGRANSSNGRTALVGGSKGEWYVSLFPEYAHIPVDVTVHLNQSNSGVIEHSNVINATGIRNAYFSKVYEDANKFIKPLVPNETYEFLKKFRYTKWFGYLACAKGAIADLNNKYGKGPFLTCDCLILKGDHILLIKRKNHPGRGLWALPGGYFDLKDGSLLEGCYRELKEETGLNVSLEEFKSMVVKTDIFDHPKRSLVARLITYLCVVKLNNNHMSQIEASDDASSAEWFDLSTVTGMANIMYDDHWHIIDKMIRLK